MAGKKWRVKFFQTRRGDWPVKTFIEAKGKKTLAKIIRTVELLENYGPFLKPPYSKIIAGNLFELRIIGQQSVRIFYALSKEEYYLLHAFDKKSQKTPAHEIKTALDRARELV